MHHGRYRRRRQHRRVHVNVINFENNSPAIASVTGYAGGNIVDCYGKFAAVGDAAGGSFTLSNLLLPWSPPWVSTCDTGLSQISAIAIGDTYVLACGMAPSDDGTGSVGTVVLVDISNAVVPSVVATYQQLWLGTPTSCAISGNTGVVGGWMPNEVGPLCETTSVLATFEYTGSGNLRWNTLDTVGDNDLTAPLLSGPLLVDYDGAMVIATNAQPSGGNGAGAYLYTSASPETTGSVGSGSAPVAVAEIPEGGYYVAIGQGYSDAGVGGSTPFRHTRMSGRAGTSTGRYWRSRRPVRQPWCGS